MLGPYASFLKTALEITAEEARRVEVLLRWWHGTLDHLSREELTRDGAAQLEALQASREDARSREDYGQEARSMLALIEIEAGIASA